MGRCCEGIFEQAFRRPGAPHLLPHYFGHDLVEAHLYVYVYVYVYEYVCVCV